MIRVNWKQGQVASDGHIRAHIITTPQPNGCQFERMSDYTDYPDVQSAEAAMKQKGYTTYRQCSHCWNGGQVIDPIP